MRRVDRSVVMTATVVMGSYRPLPEPPKFVSRAAKATKTSKLRLYVLKMSSFTSFKFGNNIFLLAFANNVISISYEITNWEYLHNS